MTIGRLKGILFLLRRGFEEVRNRFRTPPAPPIGTDWVGYESLIRFIRVHRILSVEGELVEIGTFLGGGARKLSQYLQRKAPRKTLYVIDIFSPSVDETPGTGGTPMATIYSLFLKLYRGRSQWQVFSKVTKGCRNIEVLRTDSRQARIPADRLCFAFIDGNHDPDYVESDFYLVWKKMSRGGAVAFHDYCGDLPETTKRIKALMERHCGEIRLSHRDPLRDLMFLVKK